MPTRDRLTAGLAELAATAPSKGALKYAYIKGEYKEKLDAYVEELFKISDFRRAAKQYEKAVLDLSALYGNGEGKQQFELERAREALKKKLGNTVLDTIRECRKELMLEAPTERGDLQIVLQGTASVLARADPIYQELRKEMPRERTPTGELLKDEAFRGELFRLVEKTCNDIRISARIHGYVEANSEGLTKEELKELRKDLYGEARRSASNVILEQLREDAGYPEQARADIVTNLLIRLMGDVSRSTGQRQAQRDLLRQGKKDLSKTAQRDRRAQLEQAGSWPAPEL